MSYYGKRLISYIENRGVSHHDADEVVSESLYKAVRKISLYDPQKGKFSSWVHTIALNTLRDRFRESETATPIESLDEKAERGHQDSNSIWESDESSASNQSLLSRDILKNAMKMVSERDRALLTERSYGLTHKEIGLIVGISENAAKVAYHRALKKLQIAAFTIIESIDDEEIENLRSLAIQQDTSVE